MWVYHSSIGPLYIVPTGDGLFGFLYNGIIWEACPTPQIEADMYTAVPPAAPMLQIWKNSLTIYRSGHTFPNKFLSPGSMLLRHRPGELCFCGTAAR